MLNSKLMFFLVAVFVLLGRGEASANDETCPMCHGAEIVDEVGASKHGKAGMVCTSCHADLASIEMPHPPEVADVRCDMCHSSAAKDVRGAKHGKAGLGCDDCHNPHAAGNSGPKCTTCHSNIPEALDDSVHGGRVACSSCHGGHQAGTAEPSCDSCHRDLAAMYAQSLHGALATEGAPLAPRCWSCHGDHEILPPEDPGARTNRFRIPFMCGSCHKEGTEVTQTYDIPQEKILEHYTLSIHGAGLYKRGLVVSAVCSDCHTAHDVRAHDDIQSSIHRANIGTTCEQCHTLIEQVHKAVIDGELWQRDPDSVPICVDCHQPHEIRQVFYDAVSDAECLECHQDPELTTNPDGTPNEFAVDHDELKESVHRGIRCAQCHSTVSADHDRPCDTAGETVDCAACHAEEVVHFTRSVHGQLADRGDKDAPTCESCHGRHGIRSHSDPESNTYPANVPGECAECHGEGGSAWERYEGTEKGAVASYLESVHGKGLLESGLIVTAMCTDCHTPHDILAASDPESSVHEDRIAETCAQCHNGIFQAFQVSIHSPGYEGERSAEPHADEGASLPTCEDCHTSHGIKRTGEDDFRLHVIEQCGQCHEHVTESYFETYHGKVSQLGFTGAARCDDCHGSHQILPPDHPDSTLSRDNVVDTCGECHEGSHRQFAGYLTHATHHDRDKYPILFYTFWGMTLLLTGTFSFFGLHTLLWLPRSLGMMKHSRSIRARADETGEKQFMRFPRLARQLHFFVIISFIALAVTGMVLKFSYLGWAQAIARGLGGFENAGAIHRIGAIITFGYFLTHIVDVVRHYLKTDKTTIEFFFGSSSLVPKLKDVLELIATLKWFVGLGPRPRYGKWTYWEKFDYFAVFWGVGIIGTTGLILWFPELFTLVLPGWIVNVATIIHSDEALLATGFIFTIHFFNTHFRPDAFPMDTVIFTGRIPVELLKEDRPEEYEELVESGELEEHLVEPLPSYVVNTFKAFGAVALAIGVTLIVLIIWAQVFGYR